MGPVRCQCELKYDSESVGLSTVVIGHQLYAVQGDIALDVVEISHKWDSSGPRDRDWLVCAHGRGWMLAVSSGRGAEIADIRSILMVRRWQPR